MPLYKNTPEPSGRMGLLWSLAPIYDAAIIEFGSMGHMIYAEKWMMHSGLIKYAKLITTHLSEKDIALGMTKRLEECVKEVVKEKSAKAIFLIPSSVPEMIGTDLEAIGEELQFTYPQIPILVFKAGNFKATRQQGMEEAYYQLARSLPEKVTDCINAKEKESKIASYNLLGSACDWSRFQSDNKEIERIMDQAFQMKPAAIFGSSCDIASLHEMTQADITIVLRKEGLKAAKELENKYGVPYLYYTPYGLSSTKEWITKIEEILGTKADRDFLDNEILESQYVVNHCKVWTKHRSEKAKIWISNEDELALGLQNFAVSELGFTLEQGEIHMSDLSDLKINPGKYNIEIRRSTLSNDINPYEPAFMGFRGAMHLGSIWYKYLTV